MMQLFIVRHADSDYSSSADHERPLSELGHHQAIQAAQFIKNNINQGSIQIISSDALRTLSTAESIQSALEQSSLIHSIRFYNARAGEWCDAMIEHQQHDHLILVGHNPTMGFLAKYLNPQHAQRFCPASVLQYQLEIDAEGLKLPAQFINFFTPDAK